MQTLRCDAGSRMSTFKPRLRADSYSPDVASPYSPRPISASDMLYGGMPSNQLTTTSAWDANLAALATSAASYKTVQGFDFSDLGGYAQQLSSNTSQSTAEIPAGLVPSTPSLLAHNGYFTQAPPASHFLLETLHQHHVLGGLSLMASPATSHTASNFSRENSPENYQPHMAFAAAHDSGGNSLWLYDLPTVTSTSSANATTLTSATHQNGMAATPPPLNLNIFQPAELQQHTIPGLQSDHFIDSLVKASSEASLPQLFPLSVIPTSQPGGESNPMIFCPSTPTSPSAALANFVSSAPSDPEFVAKSQRMEEKCRLTRMRRTNYGSDDSRPECQQCGKRFSRRHNLEQHIKGHHDELVRPFQCEGCDHTFKRQADLDRHWRSKHSKERPYDCDMCSQSFPRKDTLRRHWLKSCRESLRGVDGTTIRRRHKKQHSRREENSTSEPEQQSLHKLPMSLPSSLLQSLPQHNPSPAHSQSDMSNIFVY